MKELAKIMIDYDYDFYSMEPRLSDLKHGEFITFVNNSSEKICEVWAIHSSLILFGFHRDDCFGVKFTIECHHSLSTVTTLYPKILGELHLRDSE